MQAHVVHAIEFDNHYVIKPSIVFFDAKNDFSINALGESGVKVKEGFEYNSGSNPHFLSIKELEKFVNQRV